LAAQRAIGLARCPKEEIMVKLRSAVLVLLALVMFALPAHAVPSSFNGLGLQLYSSTVPALTPFSGGTVSTVYGDVVGANLEWDRLFSPGGNWGYYLGGSYGWGSEKQTVAGGTTFETKFTSWNVQGGPMWTSPLGSSWFIAYGPAVEYSSGTAKFTDPTASETGNPFNTFSIGGHLTLGFAAPKGWGLQGGISNFVGMGSGSDQGAKSEETVRSYEYKIGLRYGF
jgi:hypothetical protein